VDLKWCGATPTFHRSFNRGPTKSPSLVSQEGRERETIAQPNDTFRLMVDAVRDYAIFLLSPEGKVATWNQGAQRIKGYTAKEIIGELFSRFYPREAVESKWPDRELEIASKEGRFTDEGLRVRKDGTTFWAYVVITAIRDDAGTLKGFAKVTRDLTERRELEEKTRNLNKELRTRITQLVESQRQVELRTLELQKLSDERRRISRALHDELGQELSALKIELDVQNDKKLAPAIELTERSLNLSVFQARNVRQDAYLYADPENRVLCRLWATTGSYSRHLAGRVSYLRSQFFQ
jgi:PAS domain S-box-containing protein